MQKVYIAYGARQWAKAHDPEEAFQNWLDDTYRQIPEKCHIVEITAPDGTKYAEDSPALFEAVTVGPMGGIMRPADTDTKSHTKTVDGKLLERMAKLKDALDDVSMDLTGDIYEVFEP